jgi:transposase
MGMPKGCKIDGEALKARRLEARRLLREGLTQAEVARRLKTTRQSVNRWAKMPARELAQVRRQGRKSQLNDADRLRLREALLAGPKAEGFDGELWTLPRVRQLIARRFGSRFSTVHVWRLLRQLGFTPQRPEARARERDESKISEWKSKDWPRIKKKPAGRAARLSSSTKAG